MDKELKKHSKEDELVTGFYMVTAWAGAHRDEVRLTAGIVLVLAAVAAAVGYYTSNRRQEASLAFAEAFEVWKAPVTAELAPGSDKPTGLSFATAEEKYKTAAAAFEGVERRFGSSVTGLRQVLRRAVAPGALAVRRGREGPEGDPGPRRRARAGAGAISTT